MFLDIFIYLHNYINYVDLYDINLNFCSPILYSILEFILPLIYKKIFFRVTYSFVKNQHNSIIVFRKSKYTKR